MNEDFVFYRNFHKYTKIKQVKDGYEVCCSKKLWSVLGINLDNVIKEAKSYFYLYWSDGEYDETFDVIKRMGK